MNGRGIRIAATILVVALALAAAGACGRKAKPEPRRSGLFRNYPAIEVNRCIISR